MTDDHMTAEQVDALLAQINQDRQRGIFLRCRLCHLGLTLTTRGELVCVCCSPVVLSWAKAREDGYCSHARKVVWKGADMAVDSRKPWQYKTVDDPVCPDCTGTKKSTRCKTCGGDGRIFGPATLEARRQKCLDYYREHPDEEPSEADLADLGGPRPSVKDDDSVKPVETPAVETPAVETPAVETPAVETPAAPEPPATPTE